MTQNTQNNLFNSKKCQVSITEAYIYKVFNESPIRISMLNKKD
jgi:hypothetical protein